MSASRYTAMRRTVATANVTKVHYPKNIAKNYDSLYASIACNPNFSVFMYPNKPCCKIPPLPPVNPCPPIYDGGDPTQTSNVILDGGSDPAQTSNTIYDGGSPFDSCYPTNPCPTVYDGGDPTQTYNVILDGGNTTPNSNTIYDGGQPSDSC